MLEYRINSNILRKTKESIPVTSIEYYDFVDMLHEDETDGSAYDGANTEKILVRCECEDIDRMEEGNKVTVDGTLAVSYGNEQHREVETYTFVNTYTISGVNQMEQSFSIMADKYYKLIPSLVSSARYETLPYDDNIFIKFENPHYYGSYDTDILLYFKYFNPNGVAVIKSVPFRFFSSDTLVASFDDFDEYLYGLIFGGEIPPFEGVTIDEAIGDFGDIEVFRYNFLFDGEMDNEFWLEKDTVSISLPISSDSTSNLLQNDFIGQFVRDESEKAINRIIDTEKDIYYPSTYEYNSAEDAYVLTGDVFSIKFNLHFREHRGEDWLVKSESMWNGVDRNVGANVSYEINSEITKDDSSDLLSLVGFGNDDVKFQKNKLKKTFLRLLYYDSTNSSNQNLIGYSTIFIDTNTLFSKYIKYTEESGYTDIGYDYNESGKYNPVEGKIGIKVNREHDFEEEKRLSTQFSVMGKNASKSSSEGFYLYIWKDNESTIPQDLYMKVEFNHAGYGRVIPFMAPYNDTKKHHDLQQGSFKSFQQILNDFTKDEGDSSRAVTGEAYDGVYGMNQYNKYSYIHLKYCYDKDNMVHRYFIDPKTYGNGDNENEIVINLYEAKIG